jgi:hypothetical protein
LASEYVRGRYCSIRRFFFVRLENAGRKKAMRNTESPDSWLSAPFLNPHPLLESFWFELRLRLGFFDGNLKVR